MFLGAPGANLKGGAYTPHPPGRPRYGKGHGRARVNISERKRLTNIIVKTLPFQVTAGDAADARPKRAISRQIDEWKQIDILILMKTSLEGSLVP